MPAVRTHTHTHLKLEFIQYLKMTNVRKSEHLNLHNEKQTIKK